MSGISYSISCRGKSSAEVVGLFLSKSFSGIALATIDSLFGFVERSTLYGGRQFLQPELSDADLE